MLVLRTPAPQRRYSKCLLSPPGDADRSLGPGWTSDWTSERARKRSIGGGKPVWTGNESSRRRDRPNPWPEHTLLPHWGARSPRRSGKTGSWGGQRSGGQRGGSLFLFCLLSEMTKKIQLSGPENELQRRLNTWLMARQTGRRDEHVASRWGNSDSYLGVKNLRVDNIYTKTSEDYFWFFGLLWNRTPPTRWRWDGCSPSDAEEDVGRGRCFVHIQITWLKWSMVDGVLLLFWRHLLIQSGASLSVCFTLF